MKRILALLLVLALVFALVACGGSDDTKTDPKPGTATDAVGDKAPDAAPDKSPSDSTPEGAAGLGDKGEAIDKGAHEFTEITIGSLGGKFVGHFDATGAYSTDTSCSSRFLVFDHAFEIDPETKEWTSFIFDEYSFDPETCIATLHVKDGVVFYRNQEQMLASDILWSFSLNAMSPRMAGNWNQYIDLENSSVSDDDSTLYVQFNSTYGMWQFQLSQPGILDKSWVDEHGGFETFDWFDIDLVNGSGPYYPTENTIGISTSYAKVENWWGDELCTTAFCYADKINCLQYTDETSMMVDYENGVLDMILSLSATGFDRIVANPDTLGTAQSTSSNCVATIAMNHDTVEGNPLLENIDLRKAICYGTPASDLGALAYGSLYTEAQSTVPTSLPYAVTGLTYEYDPDLAKSHIDESGLAGCTLTWVANSGTSAATISEAFQAYMAQIGINIDVQIFDTLTCISLWETPQATDFQLSNNNNANTTGDAYELMRNFGSGVSFYCNSRCDEQFNALLDECILNIDPSVRQKALADVQQWIYDDYSVMPLCEWNVALAYHDIISGTRITDVYQPDLRYIGF